MKRAAKWLVALALVWRLATLVAALFGGWFVPPVVMEASDPSWSLEGSNYPEDAEIVECETEHGRVLRGLYVPSDGNGLVVHFSEAGHSITSSLAHRAQYADYAELGFASLAIDYSGVGLSDGPISSGRFDQDVRAIYRQALQRVDGDESRLLLRGCSLGTVAVALLLQEGARPAGAVLIAPVESSNVAVRFGRAKFWDLPVWIGSPHLKRFSKANTLEAIERSGVPVLGFVHPKDVLWAPADWDRLIRLEQAGKVRLHTPELRTPEGFAPSSLNGHIELSLLSLSTEDAEIRFATGLVPGTPPVDQRLALVLEHGSAELVDLALARESSLEALRTLVGLHQDLDPDVALAAGLSLSAEEVRLGSRWIRKLERGGLPVPADPTPAQLLDLFDLEDPGGRLSVKAIREADAMSVVLQLHLSSSEAWTPDHVIGLASCLFGHSEHPLVRLGFPEEIPAPSGPVFWLTTRGVVSYLVTVQDRRQGGSVNPTKLYEILDATAGALDLEQERRLLRCLLKAHGFCDSVERSEAGTWSLLSSED